MRSDPRSAAPKPILVLGVGSRLLGDDGVGLVLLERLQRELPSDQRIEFVDGGTQGIALLGLLEGRAAALFLDAVSLGAAPGAIHALIDVDEPHGARSTTAHEGNVAELLAVAALLGQRPPKIAIVGIEPAVVGTGVGLSSAVAAALPHAVNQAREVIESWSDVAVPALVPRGMERR